HKQTGHGGEAHASRKGRSEARPEHGDHGKNDHGKKTTASSDHGSGHGEDSKPGSGSKAAAADDLEGATASTIFSRRILPILKSDESSSCTQCHFAGVELRDFILEDQAKTFASLKAAGMIDVDKPDESKILRFIGRKPEKSSSLMDKVRDQELIAFRAWIRAAVKEPELLAATSDVEIGTTLPPEIIRHARSDRVLSSFIDNIWSEMGRCINCHSPERNRRKIGRNGMTKEDVDAISWIVPRDPEATLRELVESGNIDTDSPEDSQVLTKPTGIVKHGGGPKFFTGSPTYRNFLTFLTDFAAIENGKYESAKDLPAEPNELIRLSEQQLRITEIPAAFAGLPLQVNIYRADSPTRKPSTDRWATGFSRVNKERRVWQNPIQITAPAGSPRGREIREGKRNQLPAGTYVIRILIDRAGKTEKDPSYQLSEKEFVATVEIRGEWKRGYQPPKIVRFPRARD
ncbi:MAG: hypothetical protein H8E37_05355, partial [Planctomycetes bacterium]|nr:hypothetical protein [Planctomycetota bacterium]